MADFKTKIDNLNSRISECDERMKKALLQKKEYERQLKELREQEIVNAVKNNGIDIETLNDDLALIKFLKENNLSKEDILEMFTSDGGKNESN